MTTHQKNPISAFSTDDVPLTMEAFKRSGTNYRAHNPEDSAPNSDQDRFRSVFPVVFPGFKVQAGAVILKEPRTDISKELGHCKAATERLKPPLCSKSPSRLVNKLFSSRTQELKQHGGRRKACCTSG